MLLPLLDNGKFSFEESDFYSTALSERCTGAMYEKTENVRGLVAMMMAQNVQSYYAFLLIMAEAANL